VAAALVRPGSAAAVMAADSGAAAVERAVVVGEVEAEVQATAVASGGGRWRQAAIGGGGYLRRA